MRKILPRGLSGSAAPNRHTCWKARRSQLTCRRVPALADAASFTAVWVCATAAGLRSLPRDKWYPITTHTHTHTEGAYKPLLIKTGLFVFAILPKPHIVLSAFKIGHFESLKYFLYVGKKKFLRFLICLSLENRVLCVLECQGQLSSLVKGKQQNVMYVSQYNGLSSW